jgi:DeoR family suf operon transcriptional repressor
MHDDAFAETATHSTRWMVLKALRALGQATVSDLAEQVDVKAITVRHHLNSLHAEGLVDVEEQRQAVGRPVHVYFLTQKAEQLFPHTYNLLVEHLLDQLKLKLSAAAYQTLIDGLAASLADDVRRELAHLPEEARRQRLVEWLNEKGLMASWQQSDDGLQLVKHHCPYYSVGLHHPELCQIDEALVRAVMDADVKRVTCLLAGDTSCALLLPEPPGHAAISNG